VADDGGGAIPSPFGYKETMQASDAPAGTRRGCARRLPVAIHDRDDEAGHATWLELVTRGTPHDGSP
jgi:hypothetical protein